MCKKLRSSAALLLTCVLLISGTSAAYAEEGYGPWYVNNQQEETSAQITTGPGAKPTGETSGETTGQDQPPEEEGEDEEAALRAEQEAAEAALRASLPQLQTSVLHMDGHWSVPFFNDQLISIGDESFRSIAIYLTNTVGDIIYRSYSSAHGWTPWAMNGQYTAVYDETSIVEAVQIKLNGPVSKSLDLYYISVLNDGTQTGWAKNGGSCGTMGTGAYMTQFKMSFYANYDTFPFQTDGALISQQPDGVQFIDGEPRYSNGLGGDYSGWGYVGNDRYYFINNTPVSGWQYIDGYKYYFGDDFKLVTDLEPIIGAAGPYHIKINKEMNCTTVYVQDGANGFIIPLKSFLCSTGDDTPLGTFKTPEKYRWRFMNSGVYAQYATRLAAGKSFLLHSIIFEKQDNMTLRSDTYNYLGIARSAGCIRYLTRDAKWIYDHCPVGTSITVYNDTNPGPYGRPVIPHWIPEEQTWDPTDVTVSLPEVQ